MVYLTRKEHFNAAHMLYNHAWSEEKNIEVFGKCANKNYHGHNYNLFVTVKGNPNPETGFVMNVKTLSTIIQKEVCDLLDHKNLSIDVPELKDKMNSTENLAIFIWNKIVPHLADCEMHCVELWETENIYVRYYGENN
jgi:6-pyruvoyltetrahydropterin/6-carboxytetrahydropterin synthase